MIAVWDGAATQDWLRLSFDDAERVAIAVQRWIDANEGFVIAHEGAYHLFVGGHVVRFFVEGNVMRIASVRRLPG